MLFWVCLSLTSLGRAKLGSHPWPTHPLWICLITLTPGLLFKLRAQKASSLDHWVILVSTTLIICFLRDFSICFNHVFPVHELLDLSFLLDLFLWQHGVEWSGVGESAEDKWERSEQVEHVCTLFPFYPGPLKIHSLTNKVKLWIIFII